MNTFQRQLASIRQQQQLLYILIFSFATILIWVAIGLFSSQKKTGISAELQELAKPLNPTINRQVFDQLDRERTFTASDLSNFPIYKILLSKEGAEQVVTLDVNEAPSAPVIVPPSPSPSPVSVASESATPSASPIPTATSSGAQP